MSTPIQKKIKRTYTNTSDLRKIKTGVLPLTNNHICKKIKGWLLYIHNPCNLTQHRTCIHTISWVMLKLYTPQTLQVNYLFDKILLITMFQKPKIKFVVWISSQIRINYNNTEVKHFLIFFLSIFTIIEIVYQCTIFLLRN